MYLGLFFIILLLAYSLLYRLRFPATARWAKVNIPIAGTIVAILGHPHSLAHADKSGTLVVTVDDIIYNPGTAHYLAETKEESSSTSRRLQVRKRKRATEDCEYVFSRAFSV